MSEKFMGIPKIWVNRLTNNKFGEIARFTIITLAVKIDINTHLLELIVDKCVKNFSRLNALYPYNIPSKLPIKSIDRVKVNFMSLKILIPFLFSYIGSLSEVSILAWSSLKKAPFRIENGEALSLKLKP